MRLAGRITALILARSASVAVVVRLPEVRLIPVSGKSIVADITVELVVGLAQLGVSPGQDLEFSLQIRDADGAILETVPHHGSWTVMTPAVRSTDSDWQV